jgi:membrane protein implicated in regulation of membrane protease activity
MGTIQGEQETMNPALDAISGVVIIALCMIGSVVIAWFIATILGVEAYLIFWVYLWFWLSVVFSLVYIGISYWIVSSERRNEMS